MYTHSSGPCMTLVLTKGDTGEGVVSDIRNFIGPPDVEKAKEESPERQGLYYNQCNMYMCALWISFTISM